MVRGSLAGLTLSTKRTSGRSQLRPDKSVNLRDDLAIVGPSRAEEWLSGKSWLSPKVIRFPFNSELFSGSVILGLCASGLGWFFVNREFQDPSRPNDQPGQGKGYMER